MSKKARAALPKQIDSVGGVNKWRQRVIDMLEIVNMEHHMVRTQLKGMHQGLEYLARVVYKIYVGGL